MGRGCWSVYIHINKINGKKYIGITRIEPSKRWGKNGIGYKTQYFYKAIKKYGWDNFKHIVMYQNFTEDEAKEKEKLLIKLFDTRIERNGYNMTDGGEGNLGYIASEATLKKMSENHKGQRAWNKGMKGVYHSEKSSKARYKLWESEEYREKQKMAHLGNRQTEETKRKISKNSHVTRKIIGIKIDGTDVKIFDRINCVLGYIDEKINPSDISHCCSGSIIQHKGYFWFYLDQYSENKLEERLNRFLNSRNVKSTYSKWCSHA